MSFNRFEVMMTVLMALNSSSGWSYPADDYSIFWGDMHCHSSYSFDVPLHGYSNCPPNVALDYARYNAGLDFAAVTDHAELMQVTDWLQTKIICNQKNDSPNFVVLLGFEYTNSKNVTDTATGYGHKCVIFRTVSGSPAYPIPFEGPHSASNAAALWAALDGYDYITIPHHPAKGASTHEEESTIDMSTDWDQVNAAQQPAVEIFSAHGNSETAGCEYPVYQFQVDKSVDAALMRWTQGNHDAGYKLGITGSTDNHKGTPGAVEEITNNVSEWEGPYTGGLVAVLAAEKSRDAIFDALLNKRTYGTTGARIQLRFSATYGTNNLVMGGTASYQGAALPCMLHITAKGDTAGIDKIVIIHNASNIYEKAFSNVSSNDPVTLDYVAADVEPWSYYRVKVYQAPTLRVFGDNNTNTPVATTNAPELAFSSPIWIEGNSATPIIADFDADRLSDIASFSNGAWSAWLSGNGYAYSGPYALGGQGFATAGDFDGDGKADPAVVSNGNWTVWFSTAGYQPGGPYALGQAGLALAADFDGDGIADPALYNNNGWYAAFSSGGFLLQGPYALSVSNGIPVAADFDGDHKADPAMYIAGVWTVWFSSGGYQPYGPYPLNAVTGVPLAGDFDGDGKADPAVYNNGWYVWFSGNGYLVGGPYLLP
ncbi:MAG: DUF3604 domain-containing protein [Verrucomicrobia bacterium]|nr:DUF3604 domain-containing protein [Verrucomicrobiota bacterium]MCG2681829.1 DUF3604 domain-containing protein [Kiritimatiellia bacterium]MBU4247711.1 DUF3604 domain-containing protein [Verrucomicrobiota bacterium]MBU4291638.1 DUF3604 domain-containing protein [Verrucomicrobiota bacterium]MBU4429545.1 DUF3604 domain-containing protein [Verrucomicrobiota bacterium]